MYKGAIFPLFYLPPIEYFSKLMKYSDGILLENAEHFVKQSYRNRACIHSPNGKLDLIVPVIKGSKNHTLIKDVQISYDFDWQRLHLLSLQTCYRSSSYFEYYEDEFTPFYTKKWKFLFDYNEEILTLLLQLLKVNMEYNYTERFRKDYTEAVDFRSSIHPKLSGQKNVNTYFQVFEENNGFLPNLSIVDLLFNQGPQSSKFL